MTMSESTTQTESDASASFSCNGDISEYRQLASLIVDNLLSKAISKASEEITHNSSFDREVYICNEKNISFTEMETPVIHINLVGPRTPSPVEEKIEFDWATNKKHYKFTTATDQRSTSNDTDISFNDLETSERDDYSVDINSSRENLELLQLNEIQTFAKEYVNNIIISALELAVTMNCAQTSINGNRNSIVPNSRSNQSLGPWYLRWRQIFSRLMRSACLCKNKQQFRQKKM